MGGAVRQLRCEVHVVFVHPRCWDAASKGSMGCMACPRHAWFARSAAWSSRASAPSPSLPQLPPCTKCSHLAVRCCAGTTQEELERERYRDLDPDREHELLVGAASEV